jgi:MFS family permease
LWTVRRVLALGAYRRLLAAYTLNELAWSVGTLSLSFLVYRRTGSALGAAAFYICSQFVPALVAPLLVARVDQRSARAVLPVLYGCEAVLFAVLAVIAHRFRLGPVLVLALADGVLALTARPIARATTVTVTSTAGLLREGNAVTNALFSLSFMLGPAIGGALVAVGGVSLALVINVVLFVSIAVTLATCRELPDAPPAMDVKGGRIRAALAHARERPPIRILLGIQGAGILFFTVSIPVEVVFAQKTLNAGAGGYGALLSGWGAGAVAGAAVYARWRAARARNLIALGTALIGIGLAGMAAAPVIAVAVCAAVCAGIGNGIESVSTRTALQEQTSERWMALLMSFSDSLTQGVPGLGIVLGGTLTAVADPRIALAVGAAGSLVVAATAWTLLHPLRAFTQPAPDSRL